MVKIGLIQVDGKMPNLALAKLATWHKEKGDDVTIIDISNFKFDRIYGSKIFMGGSGYDLKGQLPEEIEAEVPDYDKFKTDYSFGFTSRGCIRDCGFCIVREKEGYIREVPYDWIQHEKVIVMDNNFLASPKWKEKLEFFIQKKNKVSFNQGLDIRLINEENVEFLAKVKYYDLKFLKRRLYFAFDNPDLEIVIKEKVEILDKVSISRKHLMFYILVGYDTTFEQDYKRFELIDSLGAMPFIMCYNNAKDRKLRAFARWVNKRYYKVVSWEEYEKGLYGN